MRKMEIVMVYQTGVSTKIQLACFKGGTSKWNTRILNGNKLKPFLEKNNCTCRSYPITEKSNERN
jgi:hypothetical protein